MDSTKTKYIILIIVLIIIILFTIYTLFIKKPKPITSIKILHFSYNKGNMINSNVSYALDCKDGICKATIKPYDIPDEEQKVIEVDKKVVEKIEKILKQYNVERWNNFNKNNKYVLDGNGFSMYIKTDEDKTIEASGYMMWPKNYNEVRDSLDNIFMKIYNRK